MEENKEKTIEMSVATYARLVELETRIQIAETYINGNKYPSRKILLDYLGADSTSIKEEE